MECLDANVVQDLMAGALEAPARVIAIEHLDGCQDCRDLIAMLARGATHDVAIDTLRDTEKRPPDFSMLETVGSSEGMAATVAADGEDELGSTLPPGESMTRPVRIRSPNQVGKTLGRYTIVERLGAGAMGVVYRAEDKELGRSVALKQLHRPDEALTGRLIREARSMAQVNHPNVVAVYDVGVADGTTYIAMELVTGESLRTWQASRTVNELVEAYLAAGSGLAAAHDAGLIHRDFKPDNVLVGKDGRVRVTDFGLSAARTDEDLVESGVSLIDRPARSIADVNLTTSGSVLGTPAYMAPEQFTGGNVDARTDQFNFCVSLYEALYNQRPFMGKTFEELMDNVCEGRVRPAPTGSRISGALRAILVRGLSVKPGDRFPTMVHLMADLGRDRAKPWRRTSIAAFAFAGVLGLGLGADLAVRSRVSGSIRQSFTATAKQADRAVRLVADQFDAISNLVYLFPVMGDVSAHHDQADFGLGDPIDDQHDLDDIHERLVSADWRLARDFGGREHPSILAVADYKARMLYTSADPTAPRTDLSTLPWVKQALDAGSGNSTTLIRYDDPGLVATRMLGPRPPSGLAMVFARTRSLGEAAKTQFFQIVEARGLLDQIRLDDTLLSIVAPDGTPVGDVAPELIAVAPREGQAEITLDGVAYEVQSRPLTGFGAQAMGRLVMAQRMDGVLSLFPNARAVFALGALAMLALGVSTLVKTRRITGARAD